MPRRLGTARRLLRLWRLYATMDLIWVLRDTRAFVIYVLSEIVASLGGISAMVLLSQRFAGIGAWTQAQVLFMLGYALLARGVVDVMFNYNVLFISRRLGRGQLDHTLIQPQPLWMALLTEGFAPFSGSAGLISGIALTGWALSRLGLHPGPGWWALLGVQLLASVTIVTAFSYTWGTLAFWAPRAAEEINSSTMRLVEQLKPFPLDGLSAPLTFGLLTILPVGFVAWYPCRTLLGLDASPLGLAAAPLAALVFGMIAVICFQRGLRHYGQTGSTRYLSFGHRR